MFRFVFGVWTCLSMSIFCSAGLDVVFEAALYAFSDAMTPLPRSSLARVVHVLVFYLDAGHFRVED